jgi:hypothetical protein
MRTAIHTLVNTEAVVAAARHRATSAWCIGFGDQIASFMPNTKHLRLREPSSG